MQEEQAPDLYVTDQTTPESHSVRIRDSIQIVVRTLFYFHLSISALYTIMLLILEPRARQSSLSFALTLVYGLMICWILLFNFTFVLLKKQSAAIWCNRFVVKLFIMIFPLPFFIAAFQDHFLNLRSVRVLMIYFCVISVLMIIYEIYSCTFGHHDEPSFLFEPRNLSDPSREVQQFNKSKKQQKQKHPDQDESMK